VAEASEYGIAGINEGLISAPEVPFGGIEESGVGREADPHGIEEYLKVKHMALGGL
jgi:succinate-semialdehyde dehydrogenase/glutarate-semialdehyde dehydrogenase